MASKLVKCVLISFTAVLLFLITASILFAKFHEKLILFRNFKIPFSAELKEIKEVFLPSDLGMEYKNITIRSPISKGSAQYFNLSGWLIHHNEQSKYAPTIVYFHESDYSPSETLHMIYKFYSILAKCNVLMINYRGYGLSEGTISVGGTLLDAEATMDYVFTLREIDKSNLYIFGASYGGSVAINTAVHYQQYLKGLILQNTFTSYTDLTGYLLSYAKPILPYLMNLQIPNSKRISKITCPIMFIVGRNDRLIPSWMMMQLHNAATNSIYRKYYDVFNDDASNRKLNEILNAEKYPTWFIGEELFDEKVQLFLESCDLLFGDHIHALRRLNNFEQLNEDEEQIEKQEDL